MKPKMIVHIGTPKTGTTTIQRALHEVRMRMRTDCDVYFASTERGRLKGRHNSMARAALGSSEEVQIEQRAIYEDFERSGANAIFLTDEILSAPRSCMSDFFRPFAKDFDLTVICYLRRQDYFIESLYNQAIRKRNFRAVPSIIEFSEDEVTAPRGEFHAILSDWAEFATHMQVRDFRKECKDVGLLESFQKAAGLTALGELKAKDENLSQDLRMLLTLCMLNAGVIHDEPKESVSELTRSVFRAGQALVDAKAYTPIKNTLGRIQREKVLASYTESNELLERDFGVKFSDERPKEPDLPLLVPDGDYLLALLGELSPVDAIRFHRKTQSYLVTVLGSVPKQRLVDPSLVATKNSFAGSDLEGEEDGDDTE